MTVHEQVAHSQGAARLGGAACASALGRLHRRKGLSVSGLPCVG